MSDQEWPQDINNLSDDMLARYALVASPEVAAAVIANPASSETTKAAAQLNL